MDSSKRNGRLGFLLVHRTERPRATCRLPRRGSSSHARVLPIVEEGAVEGYSCFSYPLTRSYQSLPSTGKTRPRTDPPPPRQRCNVVEVTPSAPRAANRYRPTSSRCTCTRSEAVRSELAPDVGLESRKRSTSASSARDAHGAWRGEPMRAEICTHATEPPKLAAWLGWRLRSGDPTSHEGIFDGAAASSVLRSIRRAWPHMHRSAGNFIGVAAGNVSIPLLDVPNWISSTKSTYATGADLAAAMSFCRPASGKIPRPTMFCRPYSSNESARSASSDGREAAQCVAGR